MLRIPEFTIRLREDPRKSLSRPNSAAIRAWSLSEEIRKGKNDLNKDDLSLIGFSNRRMRISISVCGKTAYGSQRINVSLI